MNGIKPKDVMLSALRLLRTGKHIPIWELEFHLWNAFTKDKVIVGTEFAQLSNSGQERALQCNAETILQISSNLHFSAITIPGGYWEIAPGHPAYWWLPPNARIKQAQWLQKLGGEEFLLIANTGGVIAIPDADQYIDFSMKLLEAPEEIDKIAAECLQTGKKQALVFKDIGIDAFLTASDVAENRGLYFSDEQMNRFIYPYLSEWAGFIKDLSGFPILHTDGNIHSCLEKLAETGVAAIQSLDPVAGMDMKSSLKRVGSSVCLCGNIDCGLLLGGTPDDVYNAAKELIQDCKSWNSFILGASNAVEFGAKKENYLALIDAWKEFGSDGR